MLLLEISEKQALSSIPQIKSCLEPQQTGKWLGFVIDLNDGNFFVPSEKLESLKSSIKAAYPLTRVPVRSLASIVGKMSMAIGPVSRLRTRQLYQVIDTRRSWCDSVILSSDA